MNLRETQAAETREKLFISARSLFAKKGYKGTSVREINRNVGLADGLLYHYYPGGKAEIFRTVLDDASGRIIASFPTNEKLAAYLASPAPTVFFIFVEREADKRTKLVKAIGAGGMVVTLEAVKDRNTLFIWLAQMAAKAGKKPEASAAARLLDFAGTDMMTLKNEMEKLICCCMERDRIGECIP